MARGFFASSTLVATKAPVSLVPKCGACGFCNSCHSPKLPVSGKGRRRILIVGEFPSAADDEGGMHFVGESGSFLRGILDAVGLNMREDCWLTNAIICHPDGKTDKEIDSAVSYCRPVLMRTIQELDPVLIIPLGQLAVKSLIGGLWKEADVGPITRWVGWRIPCQKPNVWICPTFHPTFVRREKKQVLEAAFRRHLRAAAELSERPWKTLPEPNKQVEVILDTDEAARVIRRMKEKGGPIAVDYENTCLKPEYPGAEIVCCSLCWRGKKTIAYPWHGAAIEATKEILHSPNCQFIAANLKHEDRWTRHVFGRPVRVWLHDTMIAAHALDNRPHICGLKFQAFVRLGAESYDDHIKRFLAAKGDARLNRVKTEVDMRQLLLYCGMDTLLEYWLAMVQRADLEHGPSSEPLHVNVCMPGSE